MSDAQIFNGIATILEAGASKARQWPYNAQAHVADEILAAMALMARVIAESVTE